MLLKPEKNEIYKVALIGIIIIDLLLLFLFDVVEISIIKIMVTLTFFLFNIYMIYYLALVLTMTYELRKDGLCILGIFGLKNIFIPFEDIASYSRKISLLELHGISGIFGDKFAIGGSKSSGKDYYITSSKKTIFLKTENMTYGISPSDAEPLIEALKTHGIMENLKEVSFSIPRKVRSDIQGKKIAESIFLYIFVILFFILGTTAIFYYNGLFHEMIKTSQIGDSIKYVTSLYYFKEVFYITMLLLLASSVLYLAVLNFSSVEGKYYYQIMGIPLIFALIYLFIFFSTILGNIKFN